jgi:hypothetical protein
VGLTAVVTVNVNAGVTASTVRFTAAVWLVEGPIPVTVMVYTVAGVALVVVIVRTGFAGGVTEFSREQVGPSV